MGAAAPRYPTAAKQPDAPAAAAESARAWSKHHQHFCSVGRWPDFRSAVCDQSSPDHRAGRGCATGHGPCQLDIAADRGANLSRL
jgi:hypothetical protein